jgi:hypothetical protein
VCRRWRLGKRLCQAASGQSKRRTTMARAVCPNPQCKTVSPVPDTFLGRKVTCKKCKTAFVVTATVEITADALPRTGDLVTVVARRVGAKSGAAKETMLADTGPAKSSAMTLLWAMTLMASSMALVLPISGAGVFVVMHKWGKNLEQKAAEKQNTELYGGIDISSSSVKVLVIELSPSKEFEYDYHTVFTQSREIQVVKGLDKNDQFDPETLDDVVHTVKSYFEMMTKDHHLPSDRIKIVGGSGLFKVLRERKDRNEEEKTKLVGKNQELLKEKVANATGLAMKFNDVKEEVELMITALVPPGQISKAVFMDVGGSATRGGYRDRQDFLRTFQGPGVSKLEGLLKTSASADLPAVARNFALKELHEPFRRELEDERKRELKQRDIIFLNGGAVWVLATFMHPEDRRVYVRLKAAEIEEFHKRLCDHPGAYPALQLPDDLDAKTKEEVEAEVVDMKAKMSAKRWLAGAEVLKAVSEEFQFENKEIYFTRGGDIGWLLVGIIIEKRKAQQ